MSYYAFFKGWLLLSQPPGCHGAPPPLTLSADFGTLADDLGSFPLGNETYLPLPDSRIVVAGIQSLVGFGSPVRPLAHPVLYLRSRNPQTPYLNMFRREPAITQLD